MKNMIASRAPGAVIRFFLLEKMMPAGLELLIGGLRDAQFGPSISFGLGGVWVEALQDAVFGILTMSRREQLKMIAETKAGAFIEGFRGSAPLDREAALSTINAVSSLLTNHPEIVEIDLNPVRLYARSAVALDARIVLRTGGRSQVLSLRGATRRGNLKLSDSDKLRLLRHARKDGWIAW
jgi:acetyl-CoA synthetase (ADP-forming)